MLKIDPHASWGVLRERAAATENPRHKKLLSEVADHMEAEIKGQLEPLMNTLTAEPVYHFWRADGQSMVLQGYDAVAGFYQAMFDNRGQQFQVVVERIVVDDGAVITEGQVKQVQSSAALQAQGINEVNGTAVTDHELWLTNAQLITVWPADDDAKLIGEDIYFGEDALSTLEPIARSELPNYFML